MHRFPDTVSRFLLDESGAGAAEYAIVVAFISAAITAAVAQFDLGPIFQIVAARILGFVSGT